MWKKCHLSPITKQYFYNYVFDVLSKGKVLWTEDAESEVRRLFEEYQVNEERKSGQLRDWSMSVIKLWNLACKYILVRLSLKNSWFAVTWPTYQKFPDPNFFQELSPIFFFIVFQLFIIMLTKKYLPTLLKQLDLHYCNLTWPQYFVL